MWHKACMSSQCKTHSQVVNCNKNLAMKAQHDHLDRASAFTLLKILFMQSLKVGVHVCASTVGTTCLFNISFFYHHNCSLVFCLFQPTLRSRHPTCTCGLLSVVFTLILYPPRAYSSCRWSLFLKAKLCISEERCVRGITFTL